MGRKAWSRPPSATARKRFPWTHVETGGSSLRGRRCDSPAARRPAWLSSQETAFEAWLARPEDRLVVVFKNPQPGADVVGVVLP